MSEKEILKPGRKTSEFWTMFALIAGFFLMSGAVVYVESAKEAGSYGGSFVFAIIAAILSSGWTIYRGFLKVRFGEAAIGKLDDLDAKIRAVIGDTLKIIDTPITGNQQPTSDGQIPERRDD